MQGLDLELMFEYVQSLQESVKTAYDAKTSNYSLETKIDCPHHSHSFLDNTCVCTNCGFVIESNVSYDVSFDQQQQAAVIEDGSSVTSIAIGRQGSREMKRLALIEQRLSNRKYQSAPYKNAGAFKRLICGTIGNKVADQHITALNQFTDKYWHQYANKTKTKGDNCKAICLLMIMLYLVDNIKEPKYHQPLISALMKESSLKPKHYHNALAYVASTFKIVDNEESPFLGINLNLSLLSFITQ